MDSRLYHDDFYSYWVSNMNSYDIPTNKENNELAIRTKQGDQLAFEELLNRNKRLILNFANKFTNNRSMCAELLQYGSNALYDATLSYDESRGNFISYASMFIRKAMNKALADNFSGYRLPSGFYRQMSGYKTIESKCLKLEKSLPSDDELKERLDLSSESLERIKHYSTLEAVSLNELIGEEEKIEFMDNISDPSEVVIDRVDKVYMDDLLKVLKHKLAPHKYFVIYNRFFAQKRSTQPEIGRRMGLTRQAIQIIESKVYDTIKNALNINLSEYICRNNLGNLRCEPVTPENIINYFYIRNLLTPVERKLFKISIFGECYYTLENYATFFELSVEEVQEMFLHIKQILDDAKEYSNGEQYREFCTSMKERYKAKMYDLDLDGSIDVDAPTKNLYITR